MFVEEIVYRNPATLGQHGGGLWMEMQLLLNGKPVWSQSYHEDLPTTGPMEILLATPLVNADELRVNPRAFPHETEIGVPGKKFIRPLEGRWYSVNLKARSLLVPVAIGTGIIAFVVALVRKAR